MTKSRFSRSTGSKGKLVKECWNINIKRKTYNYSEAMKSRVERYNAREAAKREREGDLEGEAPMEKGPKAEAKGGDHEDGVTVEKGQGMRDWEVKKRALDEMCRNLMGLSDKEDLGRDADTWAEKAV